MQLTLESPMQERLADRHSPRSDLELIPCLRQNLCNHPELALNESTLSRADKAEQITEVRSLLI